MNWIIRQIALIRFRLGWCHKIKLDRNVKVPDYWKQLYGNELWQLRHNDLNPPRWINQPHWHDDSTKPGQDGYWCMWTTYKTHPDPQSGKMIIDGLRKHYGRFTCIANWDQVNCFWLLQLDIGKGTHKVQEVDVLERLWSPQRNRYIWGMSLHYGEGYKGDMVGFAQSFKLKNGAVLRSKKKEAEYHHIQTTFKSKWMARWIEESVHAVTFDYWPDKLVWYIDGVKVMQIKNYAKLIHPLHFCVSNRYKQPDEYKQAIKAVFHDLTGKEHLRLERQDLPLLNETGERIDV